MPILISPIAAGTHPEWVRKSDALQRVKDRRIFAAERFKQMQIDNIQGLYEYEVREAEASFKVSGGGVLSCTVLSFVVGRMRGPGGSMDGRIWG
jgi:hypothetical protein